MAKVHIISGKDSFRRALRIDAIKKNILNHEFVSLAYIELNNPSIADLSSALGSQGFGFFDRLLVVNDLGALEKKSEDNEVEAIIKAIESRTETLTVILCSEKVNGTIKLVKSLKKLSDIDFEDYDNFTPWDTEKVTKWLSSALPEGLKISTSDLNYLVEYLGNEDSALLYNEVRRLAIINPNVDKALINRECKSKDDVFKFIRVLAQGDIKSANIELDRLLDQGEVNVGTLALLSSSVTRYLKLKLIEQLRYPKEEEAAMLGVSPGRIYFMKKEVESMKIDKLKALEDNIYNIEKGIKTGKYGAEKAFRFLVNR